MAMQKLANQLAQTMRRLRGDASQREFARKLGISVATLSRIESAQQNVSLATLERMCVRLKCKVGTLFGESS